MEIASGAEDAAGKGREEVAGCRPGENEEEDEEMVNAEGELAAEFAASRRRAQSRWMHSRHQQKM